MVEGMIDLKETEVNTRVLIYELLEFVDDVGRIRSRHAIEYVHKILNRNSADRQLEVYHQTQNFQDVVDYIHSQFLVQ